MNLTPDRQANADSVDTHTTDASPPPPKRRKVRVACDTCKVRKKKCDGKGPPCAHCVQYEENCAYSGKPKRSTQIPNNSEKLKSGKDVSTNGESQMVQVPSAVTMGINSTTQILGLMEDKLHSSPKSLGRNRLWGWNLGMRTIGPLQTAPQSIFQIVSRSHLDRLIVHFFNTINSMYNLLDRDETYDWCDKRELAGISVDPEYDSVLSMMAALGMYFSNEGDWRLEEQLFDNARACLNQVFEEEVSPLYVIAWLLRAAYLRANGSPHSAWLASCTAVEMYEAMTQIDSYNSQLTTLVSEKIVQRLYWVTKIVNSAISYDIGRYRANAAVITPSSRLKYQQVQPRGSSAIDLMLASFDLLDPCKRLTVAELESVFYDLISMEVKTKPLFLSKITLVMVTYRRLFVTALSVSQLVNKRMIEIGEEGLIAARGILKKPEPWWNLTHMPLQFLCILLLMDDQNSINVVGKTMDTLRAVKEKYPTQAVTETVAFAEMMISKTIEKKTQETRVLSAVLQAPLPKASVEASDSEEVFKDPSCEKAVNAPTTDDFQPTLDGLDWDLFLSTGTVAFDFNNQQN